MIDMHMKRIAVDNVNPTMGVLMTGGRPFCVTLERPWRNNARGDSCIPKGIYHCLRCRNSPDYMCDSPTFGDTFQVYNVEERRQILFHKGNIMDDTHGCIILGEYYGSLGGKQAVKSSGAAFAEFMEILKNTHEFMLTITEH